MHCSALARRPQSHILSAHRLQTPPRSDDNRGMKPPPRLQALIEEGLIDTVVRQLMSGKEAMVYVVRCGDDTRCAKIYKEATQRSFRQAVDYTENRKVKNSRSARAMAKGSRFGRQQQEAAWQSAEEQARAHHASLLTEVVRMLCAGVVHGDLSEFNILLAADGPVIIDLPQAVDAAGNNHAQRMLLRDVANLRDFFGRFAPELQKTDYGSEIWDLYQRGILHPDTVLTGKFTHKAGVVDVGNVMRVIDDARSEETARRLRMATPR